MKIVVDFEFAFSADSRSHSMVIDLADPTHRKLASYVSANPSIEELEDELPNYLQYDLIMPKTQVLNIVQHSDRLEYDLELELNGQKFTNHEVLPFEWTMDEQAPAPGADLEAYITDWFSGTHHNFDVLDLSVRRLGGGSLTVS